jgi:3-hydroxy-9,10-secoandrosta-1,3,5(10)-triene-9,17-dione monooxygenase reductase component
VTPESAAIDPTLYRSVMGSFLTGVTVVTGFDDAPIGLAASSFTSLSMDPALVLFCPGKSSSTWPRIQRTGRFCVNVLSHDQEFVSRQFSSKVPDKFADVAWTTGDVGSPRLTAALAWIDCTIEAEHDGGDHTIVVGRVRELGVRDGLPLAYFRGGYGAFEKA